MNYGGLLEKIDIDRMRSQILDTKEDDVLRLLSRGAWTPADFPALISPAAASHLELLARKSRQLTRQRFGKVMNLYAPLYISNACVNACAYCGFNVTHHIPRKTLSFEEIRHEAGLLYDQSMRHILLVSGESPEDVPVSFLEKIGHHLSRQFSSVAIEIYPMNTENYHKLAKVGIVGIALYQETYLKDVYAEVHKGPKADYPFRLHALERAAKAGFRDLGLGVLLGLSDFRLDSVLLAMHAHYLMKQYWQCRISISFPRIQSAEGHFQPRVEVTDQELAQLIFAFRLAFPDADLVLSTRESAKFRDGIADLGITRMSAGSRTNPGGYSNAEDGLRQFDIEDNRSPEEIADMLAEKGLEPVWKDFDPAMAEALRMPQQNF